MTDEAPEDLNRKDITADIILSDIDGEEQPAGGSGGSAPADRGDHPVVTILDMAVNTGSDYCQKERLPTPNTAVYQNFSRPFMNQAMWHYLPDGDIPDDPRIALAVGVGGLVLAFAPTLMELHRRRSEENEGEKPEEKKEKREENTEKRIKNPVTGSEYRVGEPPARRKEKREENTPAQENDAPPEETEPPAWAGRLDAGRIPGL